MSQNQPQAENNQKVLIAKYNKHIKTLQNKIEEYKKKNNDLKSVIEQFKQEFENNSKSVENFKSTFIEVKSKVETFLLSEKKKDFIYQTQTQTNFTLADDNLGSKSPSPKKFSSTSPQKDRDGIYISLKKMEDIENSYSEMMRSFQNLSIKYKLLKEENSVLEDITNKQYEQIEELNNKYNSIKTKIDSNNKQVERLKDINNCIIKISLSNYSHEELVNLNLLMESNSNIERNNDDIENKEKYSEPMPSFFKFVAN